jgi:hypothetical protein
MPSRILYWGPLKKTGWIFGEQAEDLGGEEGEEDGRVEGQRLQANRRGGEWEGKGRGGKGKGRELSSFWFFLPYLGGSTGNKEGTKAAVLVSR